MSRDDIDHREAQPAALSSTPPYFRDPPEGPIELVVPRADGSAEVYPVSVDLALIHLNDLAQALRRRPEKARITMGREPA